MVDKSKISNDYDASKITVLEGLDPVRKRPGMYIGGTGVDGLHHLVWEILDNAIDEAMAGYCTKIVVTIHDDGSVSVFDNGRGIPVDKQKTTGKSALETVLTVLHAGGKFGDGGYKVSGGLHGVGASVVNALSIWVKAEVRRDNKKYYLEFDHGVAVGGLKSVGESTETGTTIRFMPDASIFTSTTEFSFQTILNRCRQQAYLTKGVMISIVDEREKAAPKIAKVIKDDASEDDEPEDEEVRTGRSGGDEDEEIIERGGPQQYAFYFEGGIASYVRHIDKNRQAINEPPMYAEKEQNGVLVEISLAYTDDFKEHIYTFANNINTPEGGTHLTGFKTALTRVLNDYAKKNNLTKDALTGEDVREGLTAVLSVKLQDPQFEGQTKAKLGNTEVRTIVESVTTEALGIYLDEHPAEARKVIDKCSLSAKARLAARAARDTIIRKGALEGMTLPGKLADCSSKDPTKTEIYIVEGDSAGGSAKQGRDRNFQAILPLRGKILNVERARLDRMLSSDEIKALIVAMGVGIGEDINYAKLRYDRVIIMTDADVDGAHIRTLLLTFFYRNYPDLISHGHIYIAQPPLFSVSKGKEKHWVYTEAQRDEAVRKLKLGKAAAKLKAAEGQSDGVVEVQEIEGAEVQGAGGSEEEQGETAPAKEGLGGITIQRFKGLGEMSAEQLWDTTMNPEHRVLLQVTIDNAEKADETFTMLMGDQVPPRKKFIQTRAKTVKNLDA